MITQEQVKQEWKDISSIAFERADKTNDQFNRDLILVGGVTTAISALLLYSKPDLVGLTIAASLPLLGTLIAHIKNYRTEHFYKAFASHALDMRDAEVDTKEDLTLPRIDHEKTKFENSDKYKAPSTFECVAHFRTAIIGMTAGTAITIVGVFSEKGYDVLNRFREEDNETSQASELAPMRSPRPVARPTRN